ncbi:ATPase family AAA domain-containing protein 3 [Sesamum angolense]|uniref:ATPase family AAA domain-containing protein 3 n=1 Tax=Sesamum angolense TaxID=2727404 RepID=A0AAE2BZQ9_9LAMI|nr:ATPase family AAA domain-containing protein 3 [Sesamum angolense]
MSKSCASGILAALTYAGFSADHAYADGPFNFSPFSSSSSAASTPQQTASEPAKPPAQPSAAEPTRVRNDNPRTTSAGFDPEALERGVKALREITSSSHAKKVVKFGFFSFSILFESLVAVERLKLAENWGCGFIRICGILLVFEVIKKQEESRQQELTAKAAEFKAMQAQAEAEKQRVVYDEQKKLAQQQAQIKSQMARYEDELARKRMQAENEHQRARNQELVKMQEESAMRQEAAEQQRSKFKHNVQTEREKAEIERETIRVRALAEAEGRAHEAKLAEDVNRRMLVERANAEREKWIAAINTTFDHIGGGLRAILTDQNKLVVAVGGVTALAAGVYTTRTTISDPRIFSREIPWSGLFSRAKSTIFRSANRTSGSPNGNGFGDVILHPSLQKRIQQLANATANTKAHQAPFRNMLFYGPPGTGKTMAARELARKSGLDYALMTGGDVAPLGSQAVTKIHQLFDWAKKSNKGLLLFIDEADAFLCERNKTYMSEAQRSALNALLFRTGDQSKDIVLALATNRPGDLDSAVADRIDEVLEFPLPGEDERFKLLKLYLDKYIAQAGARKPGLFSHLFRKQQKQIEIKGLNDDILLRKLLQRPRDFLEGR